MDFVCSSDYRNSCVADLGATRCPHLITSPHNQSFLSCSLVSLYRDHPFSLSFFFYLRCDVLCALVAAGLTAYSEYRAAADCRCRLSRFRGVQCLSTRTPTLVLPSIFVFLCRFLSLSACSSSRSNRFLLFNQKHERLKFFLSSCATIGYALHRVRCQPA